MQASLYFSGKEGIAMYDTDNTLVKPILNELQVENEYENIQIRKQLFYSVVKRLFDITFSLLAIIFLIPMFVLTIIAIKIDSKGPAVYTQYRVGKNGKKFNLYKFRSMCVDADQKLLSIIHLNEKDGPIFKITNDPRVTRVGRFIRKTSIDELPQFLNVLVGNMSIVGPRPPLPTEVEEYSMYHMQRLCVKPGITCYWQVSGRSNLSFDDWVKLDLKYIEDRSLWTDTKIILRTVPAVLSGRGAW
jgi:exopolysaccharide biosynthesis polyprenyl glycosylphosphotransferase